MAKLKRLYKVTVQVEIEADSEHGMDAALERVKAERGTLLPLTVCDLKHGCFAVEPQAVIGVEASHARRSTKTK